MNSAFRIFILVFAVVASVSHTIAEEWRHRAVTVYSRRRVRLFGECAGSESSGEFTLPNEEVLIEFATPACSYAAAPDTVLMVQRELLTGTTLEALGLDRRQKRNG